MLTGKYASDTWPPQARYARYATLGVRFRKPVVAEVARLYVALAREHGLTPVELALGALLAAWHGTRVD